MNFNKLPAIRGDDGATGERIAVWERKVPFVAHPQGPNEKQAFDVTAMVSRDPELQRAIR